ncbi:MAG: hypothetical protein OEZ43_16115 [Gammaproteobacteria bacterium]|nr:hypothetical protein [Gammaproteobacteria bacterium]
MKALATFVTRGRIQAMVLTAIFAVLSLILPPFSYVSGGIIALITLRKGATEGLLITGVAVLIMGALSMMMFGQMALALAYLLVVWLPILGLSLVLRRTVSLPLTLSVAGLLGILVVLGIYAALDDPVAWWRDILTKFFSDALSQTELPEGISSVAEIVDVMAQMMTGIIASAFVVSLIFSLFLGRWWQAMLYNPGGFKQEFFSLRLDRTTAALTVLFIVLAMVGSGSMPIATDLMLVVVTIAGIPGLALMHDWVANGGGNVIFLVILYVLLLFAMPQMTAALAISAVIDSWVDLRKYFKKSSV